MQISCFRFIMIKPTRYDLDGYPYQWLRSMIPSNSMASVNALALDCAERQVLGTGVTFEIEAYDEVNRKIPLNKIIKRSNEPGTFTLIGLIGVQSNQFPRAMDLARPLREAGLPVVIGGFHTAGCIAMLPELPEEIQAALDMGISIFAGEAEQERLDVVFKDALNGDLKPIYNYMNDLPTLENQPRPFLDKKLVSRTLGNLSSFDLGRGCPFQCSFCTIINVQGRVSRFRTPDDLEKILRQNAEHGINRFFITDDNFVRNKDWEALFDRMIELREQHGMHLDCIIQVDTLCHKLPNFIPKAARAGVQKVFVGMENINPDNLAAAKKGQNKITEYREMFQMWRDHGVFIYAGVILGFPADTKETILRDIEIAMRELPVDLFQFSYLTPLPGSADHRDMVRDGVWMDPDLNKYNLHHRVTHHPKMSDEEWEEAHREAWAATVTYEHIERVIRRHAARPNGQPERVARFMRDFKITTEVEHIHPIESGIFRIKSRKQRRPGMPIESPFTFYPRIGWEIVTKLKKYVEIYWRCRRICRKVMADPKRLEYTDIAIAPIIEEETDKLSLFTETQGGLAAVQKIREQEEIKKKARMQAAE